MEKKRTLDHDNTSTNNHGKNKFAPGMTGVEGLNAEATPKEMAEDYATRVTKLEYDEYDPSDV
ncbi:hypothetical protein [Alicyclobacillus dauci]|uniref:DUF4025 domain-containing protein n=1 Tax=Alicyclobacillus dauci TaxID=1475485 RepID=A0ABY6Z861_9BACL|nr:hypothetical protein [Alicyclobacillus dauci]WAH38893.1 hypothetical protein NZD86_10635 [Alicyclobacillus dauci]